MHAQLPLIWFYGVAPSLFNAIFPIWLVAEDPEQDQFVLALTELQRGHVGEHRRARPAPLPRRGHQTQAASAPLRQPSHGGLPETRCAVCRIGDRELLDAAHILPDTHPRGEPVVPNGLALCKIHHAAYDRNILGIRPDLVVEIHLRLLDEVDGPMLRHGLQGRHGQQLLQVPARRAEAPDADRLAERYADFRSA